MILSATANVTLGEDKQTNKQTKPNSCKQLTKGRGKEGEKNARKSYMSLRGCWSVIKWETEARDLGIWNWGFEQVRMLTKTRMKIKTGHCL